MEHKPALHRDEAVEASSTSGPEVDPRSASVSDLPSHLLKTRLRIAVESLETAEHLLRARGTLTEAQEEDIQRLVDTARRELESLKALLRPENGPLV